MDMHITDKNPKLLTHLVGVVPTARVLPSGAIILRVAEERGTLHT